MEASLETRVTENVLEVRPFHLYTLLLFLNPGPGLYSRTNGTYGEKWTKEVSRIVSEAKSKSNLVVKLVENTDFMCENEHVTCRFRETNLPCNADTYNFDTGFIEKYNLQIGNGYSIEDIKKMSTTNFH